MFVDALADTLYADADARVELLQALAAAGLSDEDLRAVFASALRRWAPTADASEGGEADRDVAVLDGRDMRLRAMAWADVRVDDAKRLSTAARAALSASGSVTGVDGRGMQWVEVGAGSGFVAWLLEKYSDGEGGDRVRAYDSMEGHTYVSAWSRHQWPWSTAVRRVADAEMAEELRSCEADALLLVWPEGDSPMAADTLARFGGTVLAYIGEDEGGETADASFFAVVAAGWDEVESWEIEGTPGTHARVYARRRG